jgi:hypothetical protein
MQAVLVLPALLHAHLSVRGYCGAPHQAPLLLPKLKQGQTLKGQ